MLAKYGSLEEPDEPAAAPETGTGPTAELQAD